MSTSSPAAMRTWVVERSVCDNSARWESSLVGPKEGRLLRTCNSGRLADLDAPKMTGLELLPSRR